jgi:hypothetical protein
MLALGTFSMGKAQKGWFFRPAPEETRSQVWLASTRFAGPANQDLLHLQHPRRKRHRPHCFALFA